MANSTGPRRTGLPRAVLRWLQSLDLTVSPRRFRRDFSNGCLIAEIFSWYYPEDIQMHSFQNGTSLAVKLSNWSQLGKFFAKRNLKPVQELIDGTIHCKPGAAEILVEDIYTMLTNSWIKYSQDEEIDFSDRFYQDKLPMVARSTASRAIKTNIKLTEIIAEPNINKNRQKVNTIINLHLQQRRLEREQHPERTMQLRKPGVIHAGLYTLWFVKANYTINFFKERFNIKPTLGARAVRRLSVTTDNTINLQRDKSKCVLSATSTELRGKTRVYFKTIQVKQAERCPFDVNLNVGSGDSVKCKLYDQASVPHWKKSIPLIIQ